MDKVRKRKSRAPWQDQQQQQVQANSYANTPPQSNSLQVPSNPYAASSAKKQDRRLSIHASAHHRQHGKSFSSINNESAPPLPENSALIMLSNGSASEIEENYKSLLKQKDIITRNIKNNINLNQQNILQLTNDLKIVQEELDSLRNSTRQVLEVTNFFKESAEKKLSMEFESKTNTPQTSKSQDRSSIVILENLWKKELQSLYKHVDGASKFIQPTPGRHVIAESGRWIEINPGSWKNGNASHLFILNDLILIANKSNGDKKLHATQCFPINQVSIRQITPPNNITDSKLNFINIKFQNLSYIFSSDRYDHFMKIMDAYKKGKNELEQLNRTQTPIESKRNSRKSKRNSEEILSTLSTKIDFKDNFDDIESSIHYNNFTRAFELITHVESKLNKKKILNEDENLLSQVTRTKLDQKREEILKGLEFMLRHHCNYIKLENILELYKRLNQLNIGITIYLKSTPLDYKNSLVAILTLKKRISTLIPILKKIENDSANSSLIITWCTDEAKKISNLLNCDKAVLIPYLDEFKELGINLDYLFE
ncbi:unnamed protein product [Candida verbasci]|uniref:Exocyst complex component EXO84 n=1 Tax=Candida verbasci TaxID=1227364 RepID=A0A9W4XCH6_9ASCO|nr:unnamed protein product [Candida verbasci]